MKSFWLKPVMFSQVTDTMILCYTTLLRPEFIVYCFSKAHFKQSHID